ncbi:MAG: guanylate kinase [Gammaproteobacteria bacterium]|jgi:guanylate kinase|nr:guanylate kinase [Gammaproteobacteria bacterium]
MSQSNSKTGTLFIISAPSGAGKTTLVHALLDSSPNLFVSISHTTRPKRSYEKDGIDYHFVDENEFDRMTQEGQFLEHAEVFDKNYGTSRTLVEEQLATGKDIILEIEWQGAKQIRELLPNVVSIFILPPSYETLEERLGGRGEDNESIERRMREAKAGIYHYKEYDYLVINDDIAVALDELKTIISASQHRYRQQKARFDKFVQDLLVDS